MKYHTNTCIKTLPCNFTTEQFCAVVQVLFRLCAALMSLLTVAIGPVYVSYCLVPVC